MPPEEWIESMLGEIAAVDPESTSGFDPQRLIRYVDIASVHADSGIDESELREMKYSEAPGRARRAIRAGDILVSTVRTYLRAFARVPLALDGEVASTGFAVIRARQDVVLPGFVWALVRHHRFVEEMSARSTGSNYPAIRSRDVEEFKVSLPPLREQRRIVDLLDAVDAAIDAARQQQEAVGETRGALLAEVMRPREGWVTTTLGALGQWSSGKGIKQDARHAGSFPVYGANGQVGLTDQPLFVKPVVLLGRVGANVASGQMLKTPGPAWVTDNALVLQPGHETDFDFAALCVEAADYHSIVKGTGQPVLVQSRVTALPVHLPPPAEQVHIVRLINAVDDLATMTAAYVSALSESRTNLLTELLSGDHRIPESYDHLLEAV